MSVPRSVVMFMVLLVWLIQATVVVAGLVVNHQHFRDGALALALLLLWSGLLPAGWQWATGKKASTQ